MRKYIKLMVVLSTIFFAVHLNNVKVFAEDSEAEKYERDYLSKIYDSENGLEGTTANCICADAEGFIWFGGYTGLYRYDGNEFKKYLMDGRALPVNDIVQDKNGNLWVGTNGEGVYCFNGSEFAEYKLDDEEQGTSVINKMYLDAENTVWVGTKSGLFSIDTEGESHTANEYRKFSNTIIQDIGELSSGEKVIIQKTGEIFLLKDDQIQELKVSLSEKDGVPRCCYAADDLLYIGTTEETLLKISENGNIENVIDGNGLSSFNEIRQLNAEEFWICSDTGIGILKNDEILKLDFPFEDSIEEGCEDYQGSFWFVSSRQGVMQLYENHFSDLGSYWNIKQTVNSIQPYGNQVYVGCDDGLYCFEGKKQVQDRLVKSCTGQRIRQVYLDNENNIWVSTYQNGIKMQNPDGEFKYFNTKNSELETNKIRCIWEKTGKEFLVGTEEGLYLIDKNGKVQKYTDNRILNTKRILDVKESYNGKIYASTDGYGIYEIEDDTVENMYTKQQGLLSNVVMKMIPSENMDGIWIVTGEGICFIDADGNIKKVTGISVANSLDLILTDNGKVVVLAGNGFFELREKDLLEENVSYTYLSKQDGLPVDFTANARNTLKNGVLYMCGTTGAVSIDLNREQTQKPIRLYINAITEDGKDIDPDRKNIIFSSSAHRINIDIKAINFVHRNMYIGYFLEGMDNKQTFVKDADLTDISYTNLKGGNYIYDYKVYDADTNKCLADLSVSFSKNYKFWEQTRVKVLLALLGIGGLVLLFALVIDLREKQVKRKCYLEFLEEKENEMSELAYKDLVTGVFNRNYFEQEKDKIDLKKLKALVSVSINHVEYFKSKYGIFYTEGIFREGVHVMQHCAKEQIKICRVSENIFYFWFMEPIQLETYIYDIKEKFEKEGEKEEIPLSFSVGAIYNNTVGKENIDELIDRCGKMRLLDEKHAEAKFIESKMKML